MAMQAITRPSLYGLGLTALWVVLALTNSATTYHLAPLLVAVAVPVVSPISAWAQVAQAAGPFSCVRPMQ